MDSKLVWTPRHDHSDMLTCRRESGNLYHLYAVAVCNSGEMVVGHIPWKISAMCNLFPLKGGIMTCEVSSPRRYSASLPQGGLEHPCHITSVGPSQKFCVVEA